MKNTDIPKIESPHPQAYYVRPAHYAKGKYQVTTYDASYGFRGPAGMAAADIGAKYVKRGSGYMMSPRQLERFMAAYETRLAQTEPTAFTDPPEEASGTQATWIKAYAMPRPAK